MLLTVKSDRFYASISVAQSLKVEEEPQENAAPSPSVDYSFVILQRVAERACITKCADTATCIISYLASFCAVQLPESLLARLKESLPHSTNSLIPNRLISKLSAVSSKVPMVERSPAMVSVSNKKKAVRKEPFDCCCGRHLDLLHIVVYPFFRCTSMIFTAALPTSESSNEI